MEADVHSNTKDVSNSAVNNSNKLNCDICGLFEIHKNDLERHLNSRCHRKKLRERDRKIDKSEEQRLECEICKRKFRGEDFYKAHLGSKTHKRNLKKQQVTTDPIPYTATSIQVNRASRRLRKIIIGQDEAITDFCRKKYKTRVVKIEDLHYKTYIYSLAAYLTLRLALDQNVEDFIISVNDRDWQVFGDVVIHITYKEKKAVYVIQCKKVTQVNRLIEHLEEAKIHIGKQYNYIAQLRDAGKDVNETKFVIFTTCGTSSNFRHSVQLKPAVLNKWKTSDVDISLDAALKVKPLAKKNEIVNITNDPENVYSLTLLDNVDCHLPHLFIYTSQRIFPTMLNQLLKSKFDKYPDISTDYTRYIENWVDGRLGGNYKLRKRDVVLKLGEILLSPYTISPKRVHSKHDNFAVWNQVINKVDLTVVKNEPFIISKICRPLNLMIEETLSTNIDTTTKSIELKKGMLRELGEPIKSYFFEIVQGCLNDDIPLHLVYNIFWKAGRIPLLMSSEGQEDVKGFILDVILFMKQMGVHKKFLIKSADLNLNRLKGDLKIFTSLENVKTFIDLNEVTIRVSQSLQLPLSTIENSDPFFSKWVTPNIFFDMSLGRYSLKPSYSSKKIHNKREILKIILDDSIKDEVENNLYPEMDLSEVDSGNDSDHRLRGIDPGIL